MEHRLQLRGKDERSVVHVGIVVLGREPLARPRRPVDLLEEGVDGALKSADKSAAAEAEADRAELLELQGEDANKSEAHVELIRKR